MQTNYRVPEYRLRSGLYLLILALILACDNTNNQPSVNDATVTKPIDSMDAGAHLDDAGILPGPVNIDRSLAWRHPDLLDDPQTISLATLMAASASKDNGGLLFDWLLREFGRTTFSFRPDRTTMAN